MTLRKTLSASVRTPRRAFTLIELLVVIAIISILVALSVSAVFKAIGTQQNFDAKTEITRIYASHQEEWKKAVDDAYAQSSYIKSESNPNAAADINFLAGGDSRRARVIYISYYMKQQFPTSFAEVLLCTTDMNTKTPKYYNPLGADPQLWRKLTTIYNVAANDPPLPGESSALLLIRRPLRRQLHQASQLSDEHESGRDGRSKRVQGRLGHAVAVLPLEHRQRRSGRGGPREPG
jgi:prepilin-type N-terminal cleavage/methylation domain-containing protein